MIFLMATQVIFTKVQHKVSLTTAQQLSMSRLWLFQATQMLQTAFRPGNHCSQKQPAPQRWRTLGDRRESLQEPGRHHMGETWVGLNKINSRSGYKSAHHLHKPVSGKWSWYTLTLSQNQTLNSSHITTMYL